MFSDCRSHRTGDRSLGPFGIVLSSPTDMKSRKNASRYPQMGHAPKGERSEEGATFAMGTHPVSVELTRKRQPCPEKVPRSHADDSPCHPSGVVQLALSYLVVSWWHSMTHFQPRPTGKLVFSSSDLLLWPQTWSFAMVQTRISYALRPI